MNTIKRLNREALARRLLSLPEEISAAETSLHLLEERRRVAAEVLQRCEDALLLDPERVNGKNAEQRAAQVKRLANEHSSLRVVARLLASEAE